MLRMSVLLGLVLAAFLSGCSRPAKVPRKISFEDIIDKVHCELHRAVWERDHLARGDRFGGRRQTPQSVWWARWKASVQLKLQTAKDGNLATSNDITAPINRGRFTLGLTGTLKKKVTNSTTFNFDVYMDDLIVPHPVKPKSTYRFNPERCRQLEEVQHGRRRLLAGNLGLTDWLQRAAAAYKQTNTTSTGQTYFVEFVITLNGSAKPGASITSPTGETYTVSLTAGAERIRTHQLTITLGRVAGVVVDKQLVALNNILEVLKKQRIADLNRQLTSPELFGFRELSEAEKSRIQSEINTLNSLQPISPYVSTGDANIKQQQILDAISRIETNSRN